MGNLIQNKVAANKPDATAVAKKSVNQIMNAMLDGEGMRKRFDEILGKRSAQFVSSVVSLVNSDKNMQEAFIESPMTVIQSALKAATFDLPIDQNLGYAYIVPFKNSKRNDDGTWTKKTEASFVLGWKGMHQLAIRTGAYKTINVIDVREGELKSYNRLTEEIDIEFIDDETERNAKPVIGYVGYYRLVNGAEKTIYRTVSQLDAHEIKFRKSKDHETKLHRDDPDAYYRKTVYRELIGKWGVMSIDYQTTKEGRDLAEQMSTAAESEEAIVYTEVNEETGEVSENVGN